MIIDTCVISRIITRMRLSILLMAEKSINHSVLYNNYTYTCLGLPNTFGGYDELPEITAGFLKVKL